MIEPISKYMTPSVHTINARASITDARAIMAEHAIRHLPVLEGGKLVGMLSQRDIQLLESIAPDEAKDLPVAEAMTMDVLTTSPDEPLARVAAMMSRRKIGSAVVMQGRTLGIFTTTDALNALAGLLGGATPTDTARTSKRALKSPRDTAPLARGGTRGGTSAAPTGRRRAAR